MQEGTLQPLDSTVHWIGSKAYWVILRRIEVERHQSSGGVSGIAEHVLRRAIGIVLSMSPRSEDMEDSHLGVVQGSVSLDRSVTVDRDMDLVFETRSNLSIVSVSVVDMEPQESLGSLLVELIGGSAAK